MQLFSASFLCLFTFDKKDVLFNTFPYLAIHVANTVVSFDKIRRFKPFQHYLCRKYKFTTNTASRSSGNHVGSEHNKLYQCKRTI